MFLEVDCQLCRTSLFLEDNSPLESEEEDAQGVWIDCGHVICNSCVALQISLDKEKLCPCAESHSLNESPSKSTAEVIDLTLEDAYFTCCNNLCRKVLTIGRTLELEANYPMIVCIYCETKLCCQCRSMWHLNGVSCLDLKGKGKGKEARIVLPEADFDNANPKKLQERHISIRKEATENPFKRRAIDLGSEVTDVDSLTASSLRHDVPPTDSNELPEFVQLKLMDALDLVHANERKSKEMLDIVESLKSLGYYSFLEAMMGDSEDSESPCSSSANTHTCKASISKPLPKSIRKPSLNSSQSHHSRILNRTSMLKHHGSAFSSSPSKSSLSPIYFSRGSPFYLILFQPSKNPPWEKDFFKLTPTMLLPYTLPKKVSIIRVNYKGTHRKDDLEKYREFCEAGFNDTHEFFTCTRAMLEKRDCLMIERGKRDEVMRYLSLDSVMDVSRVVKYSGLMMNELESGVEEITNVFVRIQSDITRMGYNFTDGCGRISRDLVVQLLPNANPVPSVLQIRAPGLKGVLVVDPTLEDRTIVFRKSMQKLNILKIQGEGRVEKLPIAVLNYSKPLLCRGLNMQVIYILLERGVNAKMISEKDRQYKNAVNHALVDIQAAFDFLYICGHDREFEELQNILSKTYSRKEALKSFWNRLKTLQASQIGKWRRGKQTNPPHSVRDDPDERLEDIDPERRVVLPIRKSNLLYGVCDHRGILEPGQCYAHVLLPNGKSEVLKGRVAIMRNPCYHPGDVLLLEAVDLDVFHSIHNAIVFSVKGERPAADVCSGGDLDGDRFLVIWDSDILRNMKPVATFDYRPHVVADCISQTVAKLGILTAKQSLKRRRANEEDADVIFGTSKKDLIDYLISHGSKDTIVGRIDALLLNFQKFEFQTNAKSILTRDELVCLLTALFAASVDSMGIDVDAMVHAVLKEINNSRTPNLSEFKMLHEECIRNTEATATFVKVYEKQASLLFSLFMDSVREGHEMWKSPVEKLIPSEFNNHYGLTARLMNARRLVHPQAAKGVMASLLDNDFDLLRGCLDENTFMTCCQAVSGLEARIDSSLNACQSEELTAIQFSEDVILFEKCYKNRLEFENLFNLHACFGGIIRKICSLVKRHNNQNSMSQNVTTNVGRILKCELDMMNSGLPIYPSRIALMDCFHENRVMLVVSETGSGKSTCTPNFVANELLINDPNLAAKPIIVAQPRREATTTLARRLANSRKTKYGEEVGHHIGRSSAQGRTPIIRCVTYGILLLYAQKDPDLADFSVIILDEVHESSSDLHFLFSILERALTVNSTLKIILMSASVNIRSITKFFEGCQVITVDGRSYPVEEEYSGILSLQPDQYVAKAIAKCKEIHENEPIGDNPDVLVFLPTKRDIDEAVFRLRIKNPVPNLHAFPFHSKMGREKKSFILNRHPLEDWVRLSKKDRDYQQSSFLIDVDEDAEGIEVIDWEVKVETPPTNGETSRRVIFCTNIAETSLTIPSIGYVIDSGLQYTVDVSPIMKVRHGKLQPATKTSAIQRKGRAGRLGPGKCFRLYSLEDAEEFPTEYPAAPKSFEIHLLQIIDVFQDLLTYNWFKKPLDAEVGWAWKVLVESEFAAEDDVECKQVILPDGRIAMEFLRHDVSSEMVLFLLRVWRSPDAGDDIRDQCATIAAFLSFGTADIFIDGFRYDDFVKAGYPEEFKTFNSNDALPSSFCKANLFIVWSRLGKEEREVFCDKMKLASFGMESINEIRQFIVNYLDGRNVGKEEREDKQKRAIKMSAQERQNFILGKLGEGCFMNLGFVTDRGHSIAFVFNDEYCIAKLDQTEASMFGSKSDCGLVLFHSIRRQASSWDQFIVGHIDPLPGWPAVIPNSFLAKYLDYDLFQA